MGFVSGNKGEGRSVGVEEVRCLMRWRKPEIGMKTKDEGGDMGVQFDLRGREYVLLFGGRRLRLLLKLFLSS